MRITRVLPIILTALSACTSALHRPELYAPDNVPAAEGAAPLQVHLLSGDLIVLDRWTETDSGLSGVGYRYGPDRALTVRGPFAVPFDSIAMLEREVRSGTRGSGVAGMAVWTALAGLTTLACVVDPKSCFGSCPTFYVPSDSGPLLAAEGFSSSIARALEATDVDALVGARPTNGRLEVTMRNEALETHAVRGVRLLAVRRSGDERVFAGPGDRFYPATALRAPAACHAAEGDCRDALGALDGVQRSVPADSQDLAATESIELVFPDPPSRPGLVLAARHSLLSTYLFYETMGFLGRGAGAALAALERGGPDSAAMAMGMARLIGRIVIDVWDGSDWTPVAVHEEAGPLATEVRVFPLPAGAAGSLRVRLTLTRGAWRLDWAALAALGASRPAVVVAPERVTRDGAPDPEAFRRLNDPDRYLVTYPGDRYDLSFRLPDPGTDWEVFIESRGYYYEWMRAEWLSDENPMLATIALRDPGLALRLLAPRYKRAESGMERLFWSSRFGR